jgi:hypothetical protein
MGILDNKSRVIDAILTYEGRRQIADGNFVVKYATFSDKDVVYQLDLNEGHVDPTTKIYLEAHNSTNDQITFEADDSGKLQPFRQHTSYSEAPDDSGNGGISWKSFVNGKLKTRLQTFAQSATVAGDFSEELVVGNTFASELQGILTSSIDNFSRLGVLGTADALFEDYYFSLNNGLISFDAPQDTEFSYLGSNTNVNYLPALFNDKKVKNSINFEYLPPVKKITSGIDKTDIDLLKNNNLLLGNYLPWGPTEEYTFSDLEKDLEGSEVKTIRFDPTSRDNDIVAQFFEISHDEAKKLDVIDFGKVANNSNNPQQETQHVFFVGKVVTNDNEANCFVHMFTIIFESDDGE